MSTEETGHLALMGHYSLHPEDAAAFRAIAAASVGPTRAKEGCLYYVFAEDVTEPGRFQVAEGWRDRAALDAHLASPDFAQTLQAASLLRITDRQIQTFTASAGQSLW